MGDTLLRMERAGSGFALLAAVRQVAAFRTQLRRSSRLSRMRKFSDISFVSYKATITPIKLTFSATLERKIVGYKVDEKFMWFEIVELVKAIVKHGKIVPTPRKITLTKRNWYFVLRPLDGFSPKFFERISKAAKSKKWHELTWNRVGATNL
jgi:hypothetical protein